LLLFFGAANRWQRKTEPNQTKPSERSMQTEARTIRGFLAEDKSIKPQPQPKTKGLKMLQMLLPGGNMLLACLA